MTLEPLEERHAPGIFEAMQDEEVCRYLAWPPPAGLDETRALIRDAREPHGPRPVVAFAQVWNATGAAIGSTRYLDIRPEDRQVEIGSTFLGRGYWRTPANTEAKYLLLRHASNRSGASASRSRRTAATRARRTAIERLGAVREGVLRKHMNVRGYQRDTVYFSILETSGRR